MADDKNAPVKPARRKAQAVKASAEDSIMVGGVKYFRESPTPAQGVEAPKGPASTEDELIGRAGKLFEGAKAASVQEVRTLGEYYKKRLLGFADKVLAAIEEGDKKKK